VLQRMSGRGSAPRSEARSKQWSGREQSKEGVVAWVGGVALVVALAQGWFLYCAR